MSTSGTALTAAAIAALVTLIGTGVTAIVAIRNERRRAESTREVEAEKAAAAEKLARQDELRSRTAEVFAHLLALQHSMEWLTWHAVQDPDFVPELKPDYDQEVHGTYPRLLGAMAVTAARDLDLYSDLRAVVDSVYQLEDRVGAALVKATRPGREQSEGLARLQRLHGEVTRLYADLPEQLAGAMARAAATSSEVPW